MGMEDTNQAQNKMPTTEEIAAHYGYFSTALTIGFFDDFEKSIAGFNDCCGMAVMAVVKPGERFRIVVDFDPAYGYGLRQVFTNNDFRLGDSFSAY
jgi:hypothetical protein